MWQLHAVVINKNMFSKAEADKMAKDIIKNSSRNFMREEGNSYRYRNISKQKFSKFRSKIVKDGLDLVFGYLKPEYKDMK
jgi:hypothetical protein